MRVVHSFSKCCGLALAMTALSFGLGELAHADEPDVVIRALQDELKRSMELQLQDLDKPYFIQYSVDDVETYRISAAYGALIDSDRRRSRSLSDQLRVGSPELDNTNFQGATGGFRGRIRGGGGGGATALPIDDDYTALRQEIWRATDAAYKSAVETLTEKRAYIEGLDLEERPADFTPGEPVKQIEPRVDLDLQVAEWEQNLRVLERFQRFPHVQDSRVDLTARARNRYLVNSEGSQIRDGDLGVTLTLTAEVQADDGQRIEDRFQVHANSPSELPKLDALLAEADALAARLEQAMKAERLTEYTGPVLFDGLAAAQLFHELLTSGVAGQPDAVGQQRRRFRGRENLERRLGKRILPRFMQVYDDPRADAYRGEALVGHYRIDDEGTPAQRVDLVTDGKLTDLLMSRVPTDTHGATNGHGRSGGFGDPRASAACLYIESNEGLSEEAIRQALIDAASDQGLPFAIRVSTLGGGGGGARAFAGRGRGGRRGGFGGPGGGAGGGSALPDPISITKIYVEDGHEEPVRACEITGLEVDSLKNIVAAGSRGTVLNTSDRGIGVSVIAPAILLEEIELLEIEAEPERKPTLAPPHARTTEEKPSDESGK